MKISLSAIPGEADALWQDAEHNAERAHEEVRDEW
jgi:hypothetical protein